MQYPQNKQELATEVQHKLVLMEGFKDVRLRYKLF
jgi:hypothetical protein